MCDIIASIVWCIVAFVLVTSVLFPIFRFLFGKSKGMIPVTVYMIAGVLVVGVFYLLYFRCGVDFPVRVKPMGMLILTVLLGAFLVWLCCVICVDAGKTFRLWLHRKISRMSSLFAIVACSLVICVPLVAALVISHAACTVSNAMGEIDKEIINGYFYAIFSAAGSGHADPPLSTLSTNIRWLSGLIGYLIFSGFTVSLFVEMVRSKKARIEQGEEYYTTLRDHYVVIGSGSMLETVVNEIEKRESGGEAGVPGKGETCRANKGVLHHIIDKTCCAKNCAKKWLKRICNILDYDVVILSSEPIMELRKRLSAKISDDAMERIIFIHGDRTNPEDLQQLCLATSKEIFLTGANREIDMDDHNLESLVHIDSILQLLPCEVKKCKIYMDRYQTYSLFQGFIKDTKLGKLDVNPVCFSKHWAEIVLGVRPNKYNIVYPPMDGKGIGVDSEKHMHLVVIGMSRMGMSLVTEAAMLLHFPNSHKKRTRITMIDLDARTQMNKYTNLHQSLFAESYYTYSEYKDNPFGGLPVQTQEYNRETGWIDTEFHFVQGDVESRAIRELLTSFALENINLTVAICLPDAPGALSLSLSLPRSLYNRSNVSILVQQEVGAGILNLLGKQTTKAPHYNNILPFGMLNENVGVPSEVDELAPYASLTYIPGCSDLYRADMLLELAKNRKAVKKMHDEWAQMQPWARISNRYAAASRKYKLRSIGLDDSASHGDIESSIYGEKYHPEIFGELEHNRWCVEKLIVGFRTLSPAEQAELDAYPVDSPQRREKIRMLKTRDFAHVGIRPWREICADPQYREFYLNSINMGRAICLLPEMKKVADES